MIGGFQPLAFQPAYQQVGGAAVVQPSGGWDLPARKRRTKQEIREDREKWGILPKKVKQLIISVAVQHVEEPDTTAPLIAAFERAELAYKAQYAELYRMEVLRQLDMMREEEEFMLLH